MIDWFLGLFRRRYRVVAPLPEARLILAESCFQAMQQALAPARRQRHEGVCFLLGVTTGSDAVALHAVRPRAFTTAGSFDIPASEMAKVVGLALDLDLEIVAQVHTHPRSAFHSDGDEDGANIRYPGYFSIVVPDYGDALPSLDGVAVYLCEPDGSWSSKPTSSLAIIAAGTAL